MNCGKKKRHANLGLALMLLPHWYQGIEDCISSQATLWLHNSAFSKKRFYHNKGTCLLLFNGYFTFTYLCVHVYIPEYSNVMVCTWRSEVNLKVASPLLPWGCWDQTVHLSWWKVPFLSYLITDDSTCPQIVTGLSISWDEVLWKVI